MNGSDTIIALVSAIIAVISVVITIILSVNEELQKGIKRLQSASNYSQSHIQTIYYSTTLGENIIIDANIKTGTRNFCKLDGTNFFSIGEGFKNDTAEVGLQKYVAMKGLANAIDGK